MDWLSFGNQFDHHSVVPVNTARLPAEESVSLKTTNSFPLFHFLFFLFKAHDSYKNFRGNRLQLGIAFSVTEASSVQPPRAFVYTNLLKLVDRLKMCIRTISRPIRSGAVFNRHRPRKPRFGQLIQ